MKLTYDSEKPPLRLQYDAAQREVAADDKPFYNDAYEVGRQIVGGLAVDLPKMGGQALRWLAPDGSAMDDAGRAITESANARAPGWEPDMVGRGAIASTLIKGGRAVGPMAPAIAASLIPGGQWIAPAVAATQFGLSSAQDTEDKLRNQGISYDDANAAGWRVGAIQGPAEGVATALGGWAFKPVSRMLGMGAGDSMGGLVGRMTDSSVMKPFAKGMGVNLLVQPGTEIAQDTGTERVERAYGAKPQDMWEIAKDSGQGGLGMTLLLGPFAYLAHRSGGKQAKQLQDILTSSEAPIELKQQAWSVVQKEAKKAGIDESAIAQWLQEQRTAVKATQTEKTSLLKPATGLAGLSDAAKQTEVPGLYDNQYSDLLGRGGAPEAPSFPELDSLRNQHDAVLGAMKDAQTKGDVKTFYKYQTVLGQIKERLAPMQEAYDRANAGDMSQQGQLGLAFSDPRGALPVTPTQQIVPATGLAPQDTINVMLGIGQRYADPKTYPAQFNAAADARTGQQIGDMANGQVEYNDTDLEAVQRRAGILEQERQAAVKEAEAVAAAKQKHAENRARVEALLLVPDQTGKIFPKDAKGKNVISDQLLTLQANMEKLRDAKALTPEQYTDFMGKIQHDLQAGTKDAISAVKSEVNKLIAEQGKPAASKEKASVAKTAETKQTKPQEQKTAPAAVAPNGTKNVPAQQPVASSVAGSNSAQGSVGSGGPVAAVADTNSANATGTGTGNGAPGTAAATTPAAPAVVVKKSRVVPKGTLTTETKTDAPVSDIANAPVDPIKAAADAVREKRRKRAENAAALAKGEAIPHPDVHQNLNTGPINAEDLQDMYDLAVEFIRDGARTFGAYAKAMIAEFGEAVVPYLRRIHTEAHAELKTKRVDVALDKHSRDKAPMVSFSSNAQGQDTGFTARMAKGPHAVATYSNGSWVLDPEKSGLTGATPHVLGTSREEALHELPYAVARAQAEVKAADKAANKTNPSGKRAVAFAPKGSAVVGGQIDFELLHENAGHHPDMLKAIRYYLGVDDRGYKTVGELTQHMAAKKAGLGENSKGNLSNALKALGITKVARDRFYRSYSDAPPLPGVTRTQEEVANGATADDIVERGVEQADKTETGPMLSDERDDGGFTQAEGPERTAASVGGGKSDIAAPKRGLINDQDWYARAIGAAKSVKDVPTRTLAKLAFEGKDFLDDRNRRVLGLLLGVIRLKARIDPGGTAKILREVEKEYDESDYKAYAAKRNAEEALAKSRSKSKSSTGLDGRVGYDYSEHDDEAADELQYSKDSSTGQPTHTAESLTKALTGFVRADALGRSVRVVATATDLSHLRDIVGALNDKSAVAFTKGGKAYLIADRIAQGKERGVFLHEVGAHLGLERMLTKEHFDRLTNQLQKWADRNDDSIESRLSKKALERVDAAKTDSSDRAAEHLAYFVEEAIKAGIDPTSTKYNTEFGRWFRTLWAAFKNSIRKLGMNPDKLTAQDVVDMAYGAARLEVAGKWHGTAADFRKFNHEFMGSGEGAQVYGWGTYLADRMGIGKDYHRQDVERKMGPTFGRSAQMSSHYVRDPATKKKLEAFGSYINKRAIDVISAVHTFGGIPKNDTIRKVLGLTAAVRFNLNYYEYFLNDVLGELLTDAVSARGITEQTVTDAVAEVMKGKPVVEGNLMRLDTSVQDHEWLHWDKPLSEQSQYVQGLIKKNELDKLKNVGPNVSGERFYRALAIYLTGEENAYSATGTISTEAKKTASQYLDSVGIKGVRFLDNPSRTANLGKVESVHYVGPDDRFVEKLGQKIKDLDGGFQAAVAELRDYYVSTLSTLAEKEATPHHPDVTDLKIDFIEQANERLRKDALANTKKQIHLLDNAKPEDWKITLRKVEPITHNHVVFNDKNVFRVASLKGADSSRIKFSKDTTATADKANIEYANAAERIRATMPVKAKDAFATITDRFQKLTPWLLTNHQLLEQYGNKLKSLGSYIGLTQAMTKAANDASAEFHKVLVRWDAFKSANPAVNKLLENLMLRATMAEIHPDVAFNDPLNRHLDATKQAEYDKLHAQYSALVPEAKKLYQDVKAQLKTDWDNRRAAYATLVDKMMANRMVSAMGDQAQEAKIRKDIADAIETYDKTVRDMKGPYFPLARFGEFLAVGESADLKALKDKLDNATGDERRALEKQLLVMRKDPKHYQVSSHETKGQQNAALRAMDAAGLETRREMTDQQIDGMRVGSQQALTNIMEVVDTQFSDDKGTANSLNSAITSMFLRSLPEMHALRREAARQGIEGASPDMMRAFAAAGQKGSFYNARMQYAGDLTSAMFKMKSEAKGDTKMMHIFREMEQRMYLDMKKQNTPVQDILSSASWLYHIGVSPSFMLINSTQPWLVSGPVLAGRHGFVASTKALTSATQSALKILKDARWKDGKWDGWAGISKDSLTDTQERTMLRELMARGIVDEGQQNDSALFASGKNDWLATFSRWTGWTTQQIELVNRTATALAAYRLEMQKSGNYDTAVEYAYQTTVNTQFDYSASGKARVMREGGGVPLAKLIFQFRSYQQGLLYLLGDNIKKLSDPSERKEAAATLGYLVLSSGMAAGALGLPFMSAVLWGLDKFIPDDDPEGDAETRLRNYLFHLTGDRATANVMAKGVPAMFGADLSQRIGLGDVASPFQFMRLNKATTGKAKLGEVAVNVLGPTAGLGAQFWDAYTRFSEGDLAKGAEKLTPKAVADVIKAARYATEGFTDGKGSLTGTELNGWEIALKALGVTSPTESGYYEGTTAIKDVTAAIKQREGNIGRHYQEALRTGDMGHVRDLIQTFNSDHPENKITGKKEQEWRRAAREAGKDRTAVTGVKLGTKNQAAYNHLADFAR